MAWRKADNWTAFTDGYRTWLNGPNGLVQRLNTMRFEWEADYAEIVLGIKPTPTPVPPPPPPPWPGVPVVPVGTTHQFTHDTETWQITVLEVVRGQALKDRIAQSGNVLTRLYKPPPAGQEDIAVKLRVKLVTDSELGAKGAILGYATCTDRWCIGVAHLSALEVLMQGGGEGQLDIGAALVLGETLDIRPFIYIGESETGWRSWRIWEGRSVVMVVKMDDDQTDLPEYSAVFAIQ